VSSGGEKVSKNDQRSCYSEHSVAIQLKYRSGRDISGIIHEALRYSGLVS
jgi:hypothetical protein